MAGGNHPNKSSLQKPPPPSSSSASSSHRKSRWESSNNSNLKSPPSGLKSGDVKAPKPSNTAPSPKTKPTPSPVAAHPKHPTEHPSNNSARLLSPGAPFPFPDPASLGPPPPPAYGFHMLERRTIVLADGSVRSYFALPPDYPLDPPGRLFPPIGPGFDPGRFGTRFPPHLDGPDAGRGGGSGRHQDYWDSLGLDGRGGGGGGGPVEGSGKRKYGGGGGGGGDEVERDELARQRKQQLLHDANVNPNGFPPRGEFSLGTSEPFKRDLMDPGRDPESRASKYMRVGGVYGSAGFRQSSGGVGNNDVTLKHLEVDQDALKKAFLHFVKLVNENAAQRRNYLEDGKQGRIQCVACGRFDGKCLFLCVICGWTF